MKQKKKIKKEKKLIVNPGTVIPQPSPEETR